MRLRARVDRLEQRLPPPPLPPRDPRERRRERRWHAVVDRFGALLGAAEPLLGESDRQQVAEALRAYRERGRGPLDRWLHDLEAGRCRLPVMAPEAMRDLLRAWLDPDVGQPMVCNRCGLEYPRRRRPPCGQPSILATTRPPLFAACPACGASRYDTAWPARTLLLDLPLQALDGWVGAGRSGR